MKKHFSTALFSCLCFTAFFNTASAQDFSRLQDWINFSKQLLTGTLLVNNFETSYTSTYIEIDLCPSGYFYKSVNGNFSTGTYQYDKPYASGANAGNYSGTWKIVAEQNVVFLVLTDRDGPGYYEIGWNSQSGRLFLNGTHWPYQQGGARCR